MADEVFVICNQHGHYWGKSRAWVSGNEPKTVMRARHEDEAVNTLFELSSKDVDLRGRVLAVALSERGEPVIEASQVPLPGFGDEETEPADPATVEADDKITEGAS